MLKVFRRKGVAKAILWVLAVIIILSFGVFGSVYQDDTKSQNKPKHAGKVFGKKIPFAEFENQIQQTVISDKLNYEMNYTKIKHLLDQDRIQRTWVRILLLKEAAKRNIQITDEALVQYITSYPKFQVDGKFNDMLYKDILRNFLGVPPTTFEECFRDKLIIDKLVDQETAAITVSGDDVKEAFRQYNEKIQVSYVLFANDDFKNQITVDDSQVQKYYETHKSEFATPPMVNVEYLRFDFAGDQTNKKPDDIRQEDRDAAWNKAYNISQELKGKTDLTEIAKANNLPISESGFFSMEQPNLKAGWPFELIQQIFSMKPGEISSMVETSQGYQILRMKETKPASMPELSEVKDRVAEEWKTAEAAKLAKAEAEEASAKIRGAKTDFAKAAKDMKWDVVQTPAFGRTENYLPKLGPAPDFMDKAFSLTAEQPLSDVAETSKGYCLIHLDNRTEADMTDFEKEKSKFESAILLEKKTKAFNDFLTRLRLSANLESYLTEDQKTN